MSLVETETALKFETNIDNCVRLYRRKINKCKFVDLFDFGIFLRAMGSKVLLRFDGFVSWSTKLATRTAGSSGNIFFRWKIVSNRSLSVFHRSKRIQVFGHYTYLLQYTHLLRAQRLTRENLHFHRKPTNHRRRGANRGRGTSNRCVTR